AGVARGGRAAVAGEQGGEYRRMFGHEAEQERGGAVRRAVVDDDHAERRVRLGQRAAHDVRDDVGAVEGRDDDVV
ncbi:MAG: hypothetical protein AVDCRST_MAG39-501, partial [uncultured Sphingomonadaceae bacterium]